MPKGAPLQVAEDRAAHRNAPETESKAGKACPGNRELVTQYTCRFLLDTQKFCSASWVLISDAELAQVCPKYWRTNSLHNASEPCKLIDRRGNRK